jgi:hypothetical protein
MGHLPAPGKLVEVSGIAPLELQSAAVAQENT